MAEPLYTPFRRIEEFIDEWLTDEDVNLPAKYFSEYCDIGCPLIHHSDEYANGYKVAADQLVSRKIPPEWRARGLIYPIVFLYRHHIELQIKQIIYLSRVIDGDHDERERGHDLPLLWGFAEKALYKFWPAEHHAHLKRVGLYLAGYERLDPNAEAFRYPLTKSNEASVGALRDIDLERLSDGVDRLSAFFRFCIQRLEYRAFLDKSVVKIDQ
jgi:hypothetical protein